MLTDYSKIAINPRFCGCRCEKTTKIRVPGMQSISPSNVRKVSIRPRASSLIEQPSIGHCQVNFCRAGGNRELIRCVDYAIF